MPVLRVLADDEVAKLVGNNGSTPNLRAQIAAEYDALIANVSPGQYATVTLDEDESKANVRNRLKAAAERRGLTIEFRRTRDQSVIFHLEEKEVAT